MNAYVYENLEVKVLANDAQFEFSSLILIS